MLRVAVGIFCWSLPPPLPVTRRIFALVPNQKNQTLQRLDLDNNQIGDLGATALGEGIAVSPVLLFFLSLLSAVTTPPPVTQPRFCFVPNQKNQTLQTLYLHGNNIGDAGAVALADGIKVSTVLASFFVFGLPR